MVKHIYLTWSDYLMNPIPSRSMKPIQEAYGLAYSDMVKLLEIPKGTLSSYIRGLTLPPRPLVEKIISYFFKGNRSLKSFIKRYGL